MVAGITSAVSCCPNSISKGIGLLDDCWLWFAWTSVLTWSPSTWQEVKYQWWREFTWRGMMDRWQQQRIGKGHWENNWAENSRSYFYLKTEKKPTFIHNWMNIINTFQINNTEVSNTQFIIWLQTKQKLLFTLLDSYVFLHYRPLMQIICSIMYR